MSPFEFFTGVPANTTPVTFIRNPYVSRSKQMVLTPLGDFVSVKDYVYIRVAKLVGEQQVGINLFYLVDGSRILGYRNGSGYYIRKGATKRGKKTKKMEAPKQA